MESFNLTFLIRNIFSPIGIMCDKSSNVSSYIFHSAMVVEYSGITKASTFSGTLTVRIEFLVTLTSGQGVSINSF